MQVNDMLEHGNKIIKAFRVLIICLNIKKKKKKNPDNAAYDYVLHDVNSFIQKIESKSEKINLSLFEDFFESSSPTDYAKTLINIKNPDENKEY